MNAELANKVAELEARVAQLEAQAPAKKRASKASKEGKATKAPSKGNLDWIATVKQTVIDMGANGWEGWTDASGNVFAGSKPAVIDGRNTHVFIDTGKEANYAKGGLARASYLKAKDSPEEQEKLRARAAKRAEVVAKKASGVVEEKPKRVMTDEHKAKMKAGREAAKAAKAAPAVSTPVVTPKPVAAPVVAAPVAAPKAKKVKIAAKAPEPKVYDLSFNGWTFNGEDYITNERGDVLTLEGDWVGRYNGKIIDEAVERPTDIDAFLSMDE
jgi:hypothetical protein